MHGGAGGVRGRAPLGSCADGSRAHRAADRARGRPPVREVWPRRPARGEIRAGEGLQQQGTLALHTTRALLVKQQTMLANALRSLAAEFGLVGPLGFGKLNELVAQVAAEAGVPEAARRALQALHGQFHAARDASAKLEAAVVAHARQDETARSLATIPGVGPITASLIAATIVDVGLFKSARHFAAWLGLVPRQHSTGGKARLGRITKAGNQQIRTLLVLGATSMARRAGRWNSAVGAWVRGVLAVVAMEVVPGQAGDGWLAAQDRVGPPAVVAVQPGAHGLGALGRAREGLQVGSFAQGGLDKPFGLAVGPGRIRPGALVLQAGCATGIAEGVADIGRAVVGHHPLDPDAEAGEPGQGPPEEGHRTLLALVGQDLRVGEPGGVVDADMEEVPATAAFLAAPVAGDSVPDAVDPPELLDVEVDQLARAIALIADDRGLSVQGGEAVPALVEPELFVAAQAQLQENRRHKREGRRRPGWLLQGLVACRRCGYAFYGKMARGHIGGGKTADYGYYRCLGTDGHRFGGTAPCTNRSIRSDCLERAVWNEIRVVLEDPQRLAVEYRRRLDELQHGAGNPNQAASLDRQIDGLRRGIARLIDSYAEGVIDRDEFLPRIAGLKERLARVMEQRQALLEAAEAERSLTLLVGRVEDFAAQVHRRLDELDWQGTREIVRSLVRRIEIDGDAVEVVFRVPPLAGSSGPAGRGAGGRSDRQHCGSGHHPSGRCPPARAVRRMGRPANPAT